MTIEADWADLSLDGKLNALFRLLTTLDGKVDTLMSDVNANKADFEADMAEVETFEQDVLAALAAAKEANPDADLSSFDTIAARLKTEDPATPATPDPAPAPAPDAPTPDPAPPTDGS